MTTITEDKVREVWAVFNSHSASKLADHCADDVTFQDSITPGAPQKGKQVFRDLMEAWFKAFPDMTYTPTNTVIAGDMACTLYVGTATFRAPLVTPDGTIAPTNRRGGWTGCVVMTFTPQGKIRAVVDVYDAAAWLAQYDIEMPA